jgi:2'-5' RNA ligase
LAETKHIRLFIALPVRCPKPARQLMERLQAFAPQVKPVDPDALHLTLRFIGPAPASRLEALAKAMDTAHDAVQPGPIAVDWQPPSFFPPRKAPRTIVLQPRGLAGDGPLHQLEAALTAQLQQLDPPIEPEARGFHPHLTLARLKKTRSKTRVPMEKLEAELRRFQQTPIPGSELQSLQLIESTLTPQGPVYAVKHQLTL